MATDLVQCEANGNEMSLYYDTADDPSIAGGSQCTTPTWVFNKAVTGDMQINDTESPEEKTSRDPTVKYKQYLESQPDLEISGELIVDGGYDGFRYLNSMRSESFARNILALTQRLTTVGALGFKGKMRNFDRSLAGPQSGSLSQQFKLQPAACVRAGCVIIPVQVAISGTAATYDPGVFTTVSLGAFNEAPMSLGEQIVAGSLMRSFWNTEPEAHEEEVEAFTNIRPVIALLGIDKVDELLFSLGEANVLPPENPTMSTRRMKFEPTPMGGFEVRPMLAILREIVGNDPKTKDHKYMKPKWLQKKADEPTATTTILRVRTVKAPTEELQQQLPLE